MLEAGGGETRDQCLIPRAGQSEEKYDNKLHSSGTFGLTVPLTFGTWLIHKETWRLLKNFCPISLHGQSCDVTQNEPFCVRVGEEGMAQYRQAWQTDSHPPSLRWPPRVNISSVLIFRDSFCHQLWNQSSLNLKTFFLERWIKIMCGIKGSSLFLNQVLRCIGHITQVTHSSCKVYVHACSTQIIFTLSTN
jgi:hypothetical protein